MVGDGVFEVVDGTVVVDVREVVIFIFEAIIHLTLQYSLSTYISSLCNLNTPKLPTAFLFLLFNLQQRWFHFQTRYRNPIICLRWYYLVH